MCKKITLYCSNCNKPIIRYKSQVRSIKVFCNHKCSRSYYSDLFLGKNNYNCSGKSTSERKHQYYLKNRDNLCQIQRDRNVELKKLVTSHYGNGKSVCVKCGESRLECLSLDHINGDGHIHFKTVGRGNHFYWWIRKNNFPSGFQTLCMNCQWVKRYENKEFKNQFTNSNKEVQRV